MLTRSLKCIPRRHELLQSICDVNNNDDEARNLQSNAVNSEMDSVTASVLPSRRIDVSSQELQASSSIGDSSQELEKERSYVSVACFLTKLGKICSLLWLTDRPYYAYQNRKTYSRRSTAPFSKGPCYRKEYKKRFSLEG